jgi:hypothetical protein
VILHTVQRCLSFSARTSYIFLGRPGRYNGFHDCAAIGSYSFWVQ